jgi:acyl phosphate:glycerol-3-phosphate acyltransferase
MTFVLYGRDVWAILAAYLLGCLTAGYYLVWFRTDDDVRLTGSGSAGATNVGRVLGRPGFVVTFLWDFTKGALAVGLASYGQASPVAVTLTLPAVVAGHIWPVQLGFRGGKGIAPCLGALLLYDPRALGMFLGLAAGGLVLMRHLGLAGATAFAVTPLVLLASDRFALAVVLGFSAMAVMILVAHRPNIRDELRRFLSEARTRHTKPGAAGEQPYG